MKPMSMSMNLTPINHWAKDYFFLDLMKTGSDWAAQGPKGVTLGKPDVDDRGWVRSMPKGATWVSCSIAMGPETTEYIARFKGKGTFRTQTEFKVLDKGEGWVRFTARALSGVSSQFSLGSIDPADPIRDVTVVEAQYDALHQRGEVFRPGAIAECAGYATLRFMDWQRTNNSTVTDAELPADRRSYIDGVPIALCALFALLTGATGWYNIPELATRAFIERMVNLVGRLARLEWSNETWNDQFDVGKRAKAGGGDPWIGQQLARVAKDVSSFGGKLLFGGFRPSTKPNTADAVLKAFLAAGGTKEMISGVYTSGYATAFNTSALMKPLMDAGDLDALAAGVMQNVEERVPQFGHAVRIAFLLGGVPVYVYEGGPHHNPSPYLETFVAWVTLFQMDEARFMPIMRRLFAIAEQAGVDDFCVYNLGSRPSPKGVYGVRGFPLGRHLDEWRAQALAAPVVTTAEDKLEYLWADYLGRLRNAASLAG